MPKNLALYFRKAKFIRYLGEIADKFIHWKNYE